jgi:hypothetical protein
MSSQDGPTTSFLQRLDALLEHGPEGQNAALRDMLEELATFRQEPDKATLETVFEKFGTAVGKQSEN